MPISILPPEVASQIAAGEVVERPASVVKELLENAIDAGASKVDIMIRDAGRALIQVADDGSGISREELALAIERHSTSKLSSAEDLFRIASLGFRGEALASIGSVSRLTVTSSTTDASPAARIRVEAGQASALETVGAPQGTLVRVEDLFYNVPARLKFLKTDLTERRQIAELVTRYAVAYAGIRFTLTQEEKKTLQTTGNGDRREALAALYGTEVARELIEVDVVYDDFSVSGFISPPSVTRSNRREITLFVNGRWVQDAALTTALVQAYHTLLMVGRYPLAAVFLRLPPESVDVNVHPAKSEVRFRDRNRVFSDLQRSIRRALLAHSPVPGLSGGASLKWQPARDWSPGGQPAWGGDEELSGRSKSSGNTPLPFTQPVRSDVPAQSPMESATRMPLLRLVGQIASAYLVAEGPDGLYLIDQHAAHERVLFEKLMSERESKIARQNLLSPAAVELAPHEAETLEGHLEVLAGLGFEIEEFGQNTFLVRGVPALLAGMSPPAALRVLVEDFEEDETPLQAELEAKIIGRICKRAAVKAGQLLSVNEQQALLRDLESCEAPRTCPHGRPTMIHLSVDLLERQFGRRGAR